MHLIPCFKVRSATMFPNATWSSCEGKAVAPFSLILPPNFCALLALDTGHLRIPVIHEDTRRYLNLLETSGGGILTCTAFGGTRSLLPQCISIPQYPPFCYGTVHIYTRLVLRSQSLSPEQRNVFLRRT